MAVKHIIIDMLNDFIYGSLACENALRAVENSVNHIKTHPSEEVLYVCDCHPSDHCSFIENGGTWPVHCVEGTFGSKLHRDFYKLEDIASRPRKQKKSIRSTDGTTKEYYPNMYLKGRNKNEEQYSGFEGRGTNGKTLANAIKFGGSPLYDSRNKKVVVSGIATEFCVKETVKDLLDNGFSVTVLKDDLAYINRTEHENTLAELEGMGAIIV
ncbi:MAG: isochorismatase family protein [Bacteroidales bacterium]|jgi:nicotinamidase-related amidase|nr:isochorismatase family protein [Bacteroidales bacterium]